MALAFLGYVPHCGATAPTDVLALVIFRGSSGIVSRLASVGELVYLFEILLGTAMAILGTIGVTLCFRRNALCPSSSMIDEKYAGTNAERQRQVPRSSERDPEVTIRLGHLWLPRRHRCIVTVHASPGSTQNTGREVWYATVDK